MKIRHAIGIDPGSKTGVAFLQPNLRVEALRTYEWATLGAHGIFTAIKNRAVAVCEANPREMYCIGIELPTGGSYNREDAQAWAYARALGHNIERAKELMRLFNADDWVVYSIRPKRDWTKWNHERFIKYFSYQGKKSNGHARDAALHAFRALTAHREQEILNESRR